MTGLTSNGPIPTVLGARADDQREANLEGIGTQGMSQDLRCMSDKLAHRRSGALQLETQEVSFAEARSNQAGKWLLFGVTRRNDADEPTHGYLLYADPREYSVTCKLKALATEPGIVYSGFALLFAEPATTVAAARGDAN